MFCRCGCHLPAAAWTPTAADRRAENLFCEVNKYTRVAYPQFTGLDGPSRIKQHFQPSATTLPPWCPLKWGINSSLDHYRVEAHRQPCSAAIKILCHELISLGRFGTLISETSFRHIRVASAVVSPQSRLPWIRYRRFLGTKILSAIRKSTRCPQRVRRPGLATPRPLPTGRSGHPPATRPARARRPASCPFPSRYAPNVPL